MAEATTTRSPTSAAPEELLPLVPRRGGAREARVGAFVLAGVVAVLTALFLLTDAGTFRGRYTLRTVVPNAEGLRKGDPVQMRGVNIGRVKRFRIGADGVVLEMEIEGEYPVPEDSRVALRPLGLLGGMVAEVLPGRSPRPARRGAVLPAVVGAGWDVLATAGAVSARADTVLARLQALVSPAAVASLHESIALLQRTLAELHGLAAEQRAQLAALLPRLQAGAAGLQGLATNPGLQRAVARSDSVSARLERAAAQLEASSTTLAALLADVRQGRGTLGRLVRDDSLYLALQRAATAVAALAEDVRANPGRYVRIRVF